MHISDTDANYLTNQKNEPGLNNKPFTYNGFLLRSQNTFRNILTVLAIFAEYWYTAVPNRQTERQRDRETDRQTDRQTNPCHIDPYSHFTS